MGYYSYYTFAKVDEPKQISLSGNPNFVTFANASSDAGEDKPARIRIKITYKDVVSSENRKYKIVITIHELQSGTPHTFTGVYKEEDLNNKTFLLSSEKQDPNLPQAEHYRVGNTIYNLRECLLKDDYIRNNFEVSIIPHRFISDSDRPVFIMGDTVELVSKATGKQYDCSVSFEYQSSDFQLEGNLPDIRLTLNWIDYASMSEEDKVFYWGYSHKDGLKPAMRAEIKGSFTTDEATFLIVKPEAGKYTEDEARLTTLRNLYDHLHLREPVVDGARIELNEKNQSIDFFQTTDESIYSFDGVVSDGNWFRFDSYDLPYRVSATTEHSVKNDSFDSGTGLYRVDLDIYTDTGLFLGRPDNQDNSKGKHLTTLSKSYFGEPLWFELNTLQDKRKKYSNRFLSAFDGANSAVWVDAGTVTDYRFMANRVSSAGTFPFYYSNVLYVVNGYSCTLDDTNLSSNDTYRGYIFDRSVDVHGETFSPIKPLTTNSERSHIKGQKQYFNFILKDATHDSSLSTKSTSIALEYTMYTQSGLYIGKETGRETDCNRMNIINTARIDLDKYLPQYKSKIVGRIEVRLVSWYKNEDEGISIPMAVISDPIIFRILPEHLHNVNDFAFLNRLGGWDSFNFGEKQSFDFKTAASTVHKTLQPKFNISTEIESVAAKTVQQQFVVQSSPMNRSVAEWLKELSASEAVFELSTRRYIIVDELNLKCNTSDDLYQVEMKYRYSDTFNGKMK